MPRLTVIAGSRSRSREVVPLTVPVTNRVDTFWPGNAAAYVPPALGPDVPRVTVKVPAPLTESVIVPV
jgi:hypothetical protein